MSYVISWVGTKDGQGVTTSALALAYQLAIDYQVLLIDADQSGSGTLFDLLDFPKVEPAQRGISRFVGRVGSITPEMLRQEAMQLPRRRNLWVVSGLDGICGKPVHLLVSELEQGRALANAPFHFVVVDWGAAWSHVGLDSPVRAAEAVCRVSDRVLIQLLDAPALLIRAIRVLQQARPPAAELVLLETRPNQLRGELRGALASQLPELGLAAVIPWDQRAVIDSEDRGIPVAEQGKVLSSQLKVVERARPVLEARQMAAIGTGG